MMLVLMLLAAAGFVATAWYAVTGAGGRLWLRFVAPVSTALLLIVGLAWAAPGSSEGPYGDVRVSLEALSISLADGETATLGGSSDEDDVVLSTGFGAAALRIGRGVLPAGFLSFTRTGETLNIVMPDLSDWTGSRVVVGVDDTILGARRIDGHPVPCLARCRSRDRVDGELKAGKVYSTANLPLLVRGRPLRAAGGFLFTLPRSEVVHAAGVGGPGALSSLSRDETVELRIYEAEASTASVGAGEAAPGRLVLRRSFDLTWTGTRLELRPHTPQSVVLETEPSPLARPVVRVAPGSEADRPFGDDQIIVPFSLLGRGFEGELGARVFDVARTSDEPSIVHQPDGSQETFHGRVAFGGERGVVLSMHPLDFRSGLYPWLLLFSLVVLIGSVAATWRLRQDDVLAAMIFGVAEFLLAMRLLVAVEGAFVDVVTKAQDSVPAAMIALPLGVFVLLAMWPGIRRRWAPAATMGFLTLLAVVIAWGAGGYSREMTGVALGLLVAVPAFSFIGGAGWFTGLINGWPARHPLAFAVIVTLAIFILRAGLTLAGFQEGVDVFGARIALSLIFVPMTLIAFAPLLAFVRAGLVRGQAADPPSERPEGVFIVSKAQTFTARWAGRVEKGLKAVSAPESQAEWRWPVFVLGLALFLGIGAASYVARDSGFAIIMLPLVIACVAAVNGQDGSRGGWTRDVIVALAGAVLLMIDLHFAVQSGLSSFWYAAPAALLAVVLLILRPRALWLLPATTLLGLLLFVNLAAVLGGSEAGAGDIAQALKGKDNDLRLFAALDPTRLAEIGTRGSEGLQDAIAHMRAYGDTFLGRGYFTLPVPTVLKAYHLTDNAAAVHLISPFGRLGAAAFMAGPCALAVVVWSRVLGQTPAPVPWLGGLSVLTLSGVSLYMILANLLAAPFTGRNVYLLAPWSFADLLEGLLLLVLTVITLARIEREQT